MEATNNWKTVRENEFELWANGVLLANLTLEPNSAGGDARVETPAGKWFIKRVGFWKTRNVVEDEHGKIWAEIGPKSWYGSKWILTNGDKTDSLLLRNNPLAEYAILRDGQVLLAYGLGTVGGKTHLKVTQPDGDATVLHHALLWYLFQPIAKENIADSDTLLFLLLTS